MPIGGVPSGEARGRPSGVARTEQVPDPVDGRPSAGLRYKCRRCRSDHRRPGCRAMILDMNTIGDEFLSRQRVLVISPHADDETYGCAGTIARVKDLGGQVFVSLISVGSSTITPPTDSGNGMRRVTSETRLREFCGRDEAAEGRRLGRRVHRRRRSTSRWTPCPPGAGPAHRARCAAVDRERRSRRSC